MLIGLFTNPATAVLLFSVSKYETIFDYFSRTKVLVYSDSSYLSQPRGHPACRPIVHVRLTEMSTFLLKCTPVTQTIEDMRALCHWDVQCVCGVCVCLCVCVCVCVREKEREREREVQWSLYLICYTPLSLTSSSSHSILCVYTYCISMYTTCERVCAMCLYVCVCVCVCVSECVSVTQRGCCVAS